MPEDPRLPREQTPPEHSHQGGDNPVEVDSKFYRFRSIDKLLDKPYRELERQTIYFADPHELNDPMEGFQDIVWAGDNIVWINLFKHYFQCLYVTYLLALIFGNDDTLEAKNIPVEDPLERLIPPAREQFNNLWGKVREICELDNLAAKIANLSFNGTKHKVRSEELRYYLQSIHRMAFMAIQGFLVEHKCLPPTQMIHLSQHPENLLTRNGYFELLSRNPDMDDNSSQMWFASLQTLVEWLPLYRNAVPQEVSGRNTRLLLVDFPSVYVGQLTRLVWPTGYTACFTKTYNNSSMWANYGDGHKGVCLIFRAPENGADPHLQLNQIVGRSTSGTRGLQEHWGFTPKPFHQVHYETRFDEVDFFQSMGRIPMGLLEKWYMGEGGTVSDCASWLQTDIEGWQDGYWRKFHSNICFKTKDWEYEQEYRLVLNPGSEQSYRPEQRTLTYNFDALQGIVFGIKTSDECKLRIIEIIRSKCQETGRKDFQLWQAHYSPQTGDVQGQEIPLGQVLQ